MPDWGTYWNKNVHPKVGDVSNDPHYTEQFSNFRQKYPDLHYADQDVENRANDSPLMAAGRAIQDKLYVPPRMQDQSDSPLAYALAAQLIPPANFRERFSPSIYNKSGMIGSMYLPLQDKAAMMRLQNHWATPAETSPVFDEMAKALRDKSS